LLRNHQVQRVNTGWGYAGYNGDLCEFLAANPSYASSIASAVNEAKREDTCIKNFRHKAAMFV
jgi:hypothetical protein